MTDAPLLADALVNAARCLVIVTSALVILDSLRLWITGIEHPPHNPQLNALAWVVVASTSGLCAAYLLAEYYASGVMFLAGVSFSGKLAALIIWLGIAAGLTIRAALRAERPGYILVFFPAALLVSSVLSYAEKVVPW